MLDSVLLEILQQLHLKMQGRSFSFSFIVCSIFVSLCVCLVLSSWLLLGYCPRLLHKSCGSAKNICSFSNIILRWNCFVTVREAFHNACSDKEVPNKNTLIGNKVSGYGKCLHVTGDPWVTKQLRYWMYQFQVVHQLLQQDMTAKIQCFCAWRGLWLVVRVAFWIDNLYVV